MRTNGFSRFAQALEDVRRESAVGARAPSAQRSATAYVTFALEHPHSYKLMFDFNQPHAEKYPELVAAGQRAQKTMTGYVEDALKEGLMEGDAQQIGLMFWAAIHGAVILELSGMLPPGGARQLYHGLELTLMRGIRPQRLSRLRLSSRKAQSAYPGPMSSEFQNRTKRRRPALSLTRQRRQVPKCSLRRPGGRHVWVSLGDVAWPRSSRSR